MRLSPERRTAPMPCGRGFSACLSEARLAVHNRVGEHVRANEESRFESFCKGQALNGRESQEVGVARAVNPLVLRDD